MKIVYEVNDVVLVHYGIQIIPVRIVKVNDENYEWDYDGIPIKSSIKPFSFDRESIMNFHITPEYEVE